MVPEQAVFIPLYTMFADFGWHNSYHALFLPRMAVPIGVFLMMSFFKAIPKDIEEAARLEAVEQGHQVAVDVGQGTRGCLGAGPVAMTG